jgi:hypothetical protein
MTKYDPGKIGWWKWYGSDFTFKDYNLHITRIGVGIRSVDYCMIFLIKKQFKKDEEDFTIAHAPSYRIALDFCASVARRLNTTEKIDVFFDKLKKSSRAEAEAEF